MTPPAAPTQPTRRWPGRARGVALAALLAVVAAIALGEWLGWPVLAQPLQNRLSALLDRPVRLLATPTLAPTGVVGPASAPAAAGPSGLPAKTAGVRMRFIGGLRLWVPQVEVAAPAWSKAGHTLLARDLELALRYTDLWRAYRGQPLRIERLQASWLDARLERLADGRASWQLGPPTTPAAAPLALQLPTFGLLQVTRGSLLLDDLPLALSAQAVWSLVDRPAPLGGSALQLDATGLYRALPIKLSLAAAGALPGAPQAAPLPMTLEATAGRASLHFKGEAVDPLQLQGLSGQFTLRGPSLAAVGDPLGVTLPTTAAFRADGRLLRQGTDWRVLVDKASVGASRLNGAFLYQAGLAVPMLSGSLGGSRLALVDLGPAVGTGPASVAPAEAVRIVAVAPAPLAAAAAASTASAASEPSASAPRRRAAAPAPALRRADAKPVGKVLPNRPFDLASLRVMDANLLIDITEVDLNTQRLQPLRPLRARLQLAAGVLTLHDLDARTAQGRLQGTVRLDGRSALALWTARLRWDDVRLEHWVQQDRAAGTPPYVSGRLNGRSNLAGQGRSTAEILASLQGTLYSELRGGAVSHLAIEAAGLDVAESLGVLLSGDKTLPVSCAVADLVAEQGVFRPKVLVIDTADSAVWVEGSLSLASEALDLRLVVSPKDFSPLALRMPLRVRGTLGAPKLSLEPGRLAPKLALAALLALINPLAALLPLIDPGDTEAAKRGAAGCQALMDRHAQRQAPRPPTAAPGSSRRKTTS